MKNTLGLTLFLLLSMHLFAVDYKEFFSEKSCRIDFHFSGNNEQTSINLYRIRQEPFWGGRRQQLDQFMNRGDYRYQVFDSISGALIYTDGFNALFREWQTTDEALSQSKSFEQTVIFPFPHKTVRVTMESRLNFNEWELLTDFYINPTDLLIQQGQVDLYPVKKILGELPPAKAVDIAVIAEGYTSKEMKKFYKDAEKLTHFIRNHEPFTKHTQKLNFYAVGSPSLQSGVTDPEKQSWLETALGSHFYTFYSSRYLTTPNHFKVRDIASQVPYDAIYILVNSDRYGGGGIYNFYALATARGRLANRVTVHEFGHSFAGLGDEYFYEGGDALDGTYNVNIEPWEPNITTMQNFGEKWEDLLAPGYVVPTPLPADSVAARSTNTIGVYEGGGYLSKGVYRPTPDCRMKTNEVDHFCPVCSRAVEARILYLTD